MGEVSPAACNRCQENPGTLDLRGAERVCPQCFCNYVGNKTIKRMEQMQRETRNSGSKLPMRPQRYLLALSCGGASSTALLNLLHENLARQQARHPAKGTKGGKGPGQRVRFEIVVAWVDCDLSERRRPAVDETTTTSGDGRPAAETETETEADAAWRRYQSRYPTFTFHRIPLSSVLSPCRRRTSTASSASSPCIDWSALPPLNPDLADAPRQQLADLLYTRLATPSSRADVQRLLVRHLLVDAALREGCDVLLLGTSTTALAELTLAETAKGRGFSLPWQVNDGVFQPPPSFASYLSSSSSGQQQRHPSPPPPPPPAENDEPSSSVVTTTATTTTVDAAVDPSKSNNSSPRLSIYHPLRELFRSELQTYVTLTTPPLTDLLWPSPSSSSSPTAAAAAVVSHKDLSIDDVMSRYFAEVEANYPSVVANVVRTTGKLERHGADAAVEEEGEGEALPPLTGRSSRQQQQQQQQRRQCGLCGIVLDEAGDARWRGELGEQAPEAEERRGRLCYGCDRSVNG